MPRYDYDCREHGKFERKAGYNDSWVNCPECSRPAFRSAIYAEQYTRTDTGPISGMAGRAGTLSEADERHARISNIILKETGERSGVGLR